MGIRLDWQIEADQSRNASQGADKDQGRSGRRWLLRLLMGVAILLGLTCLGIFLVHQRLEQITQRNEQLLRDTVQAEVAALRIGDLDSFLNLQRSATDEWYMVQQMQFQSATARKASQEVNFTGRILDIEIDRQRARVQVEEIVDRTPYVETWFYWHYEEGWRHVPPDYTFWGEERTSQTARYLVRYRAVDDLFVQQLAAGLDRWLSDACSILTCAALPSIIVDVLPMPGTVSRWNEEESWHLILASPYTERARADQPFTTSIQLETAALLAERLVALHVADGFQPYEDAAFLRQALVTWLIGRFVQVDTQSYLLNSLVEHYGEISLQNLTSLIQPGTGLGALRAVTGTAQFDQTPLDWRDFFAWRLRAEMELIVSADQAAYFNLYDQSDPVLRAQAVARYNANPAPEEVWVTLVMPQASPDGRPVVRATIQQGRDGVYREDYVLFRLVDGVWLRAS